MVDGAPSYVTALCAHTIIAVSKNALYVSAHEVFIEIKTATSRDIQAYH